MEAPTASEIVEAFAFMQTDPQMQTRIEQIFDVAEHDVVFQEALASLTNRWEGDAACVGWGHGSNCTSDGDPDGHGNRGGACR